MGRGRRAKALRPLLYCLWLTPYHGPLGGRGLPYARPGGQKLLSAKALPARTLAVRNSARRIASHLRQDKELAQPQTFPIGEGVCGRRAARDGGGTQTALVVRQTTP